MKTENQIQRTLWGAFSVLIAGALAVNGAGALLGLGHFAWWHLPTLGISVLFWRPPVKKWLLKMRTLGGKTVAQFQRYFAKKGPGRSGAPIVESINI